MRCGAVRCGAVSVHGVCGAFGVFCVGLFADGTYGAGWNGVAGPVKGPFYGDAGQLGTQMFEAEFGALCYPDFVPHKAPAGHVVSASATEGQEVQT